MTPEQLKELLNQTIDFSNTEYAGRSWTKKVSTVADLLKQVDNLDAMSGRKGTIIPKNDATDEEWDAFYKDMRASEDEYKEIMKDVVSDNTKADLVAALRKSGLSARQAKEIAPALKKAVDDKYTKHYSKESFEEQLKASGLDDKQLTDLTAKVNGIMGKDWLEHRTSLASESALDLIKFAKGLTDEYAVNTPVEPKAKPGNGNSGEDPFEAAFDNSINKTAGWTPGGTK